MENKDDLTGQFVRLPNGQPVRIERVYADGYATVRRLGGSLQGTKAVCAVSKLEPLDPQPDMKNNDP